MIVLKIKVWDSNNGYYEGKVQGPAYNKGLALSNNNRDFDLDESPNQISDLLVGSDHYTASASTAMQKMDILNALPGLTTFYIDSHGNLGTIGNCDATPDSTDYFYLFAGNSNTNTDNVNQPTISKKVRDKIIDQPPFNFVFLNACLTSGNHQLADAFLGTGSTTNRGELGFTKSVFESSDLNLMSSTFWDNFTVGGTLLDAVMATDTVIRVTGSGTICNPATGVCTDDPNPAHGLLTVPKIIGDSAMTLHGVYGNSSYQYLNRLAGSVLVWYRPL